MAYPPRRVPSGGLRWVEWAHRERGEPLASRHQGRPIRQRIGRRTAASCSGFGQAGSGRRELR